MKNFLKRLVPGSLIKALRSITVSLVGKEKLDNIDILVNLVHDMYPPVIIINKNVQAAISQFRKQYNISDKLNTNVSKNDFMFKYILIHHNGNLKRTFFEYLEGGLNSFNIVNKLAGKKFGDIKNANSFLDFASGHGRLERFLILHYPAKSIWVSDIKESANRFQGEQFGVNSILSTFDPEEYKPDRKFDIIFAGSLFSHLPEDLFKRWLIKFYKLISENGILIVSTHDISLYGKKSKNGFTYLKSSEDTLMPEFEESIEDTGKYGTAFISRSKFIEILKENGIDPSKCFRYEKALWQIQDIYVLTKDEFVFDNSIGLDSYP